jgi:hypothetical protein
VIHTIATAIVGINPHITALRPWFRPLVSKFSGLIAKPGGALSKVYGVSLIKTSRHRIMQIPEQGAI